MKHLGFRHETAGILLADLKGCNLSWVGWCCHRQAFGRQVLGAERALWCLELCSLLFAWDNPWSTGRQGLVPWNAGSDPSVKEDRYTIYTDYTWWIIIMNIYIYNYIYIMCMYIYNIIYMYIYVCKYTYVCAYIYIYICIRIYTYIYIYYLLTCTYICLYIYRYVISSSSGCTSNTICMRFA